MGKLPNSWLHHAYSDWHWLHNKEVSDFLKGCSLTDIDSLWVEVGTGKVLAVFDLKTEYELGTSSEFTYTENLVYRWFINHGIPVFIISPLNVINNKIEIFSSWKMIDASTGEEKTLTYEEYCKFLRDLRQ